MNTPHPSPGSSDLSELLDRSFGEGPAPRPAADHLDVGRRSLRRRRVLGGAGAAGAAVAAVVLTAALTGGGSPTVATEIAPAAEPSAEPSDAPSTTYDGSYVPRPSGGAAVELLADGTLARAAGVTVDERVPNPMEYDEPDRSLGLSYTRDGATTWALLTYEEGRDGDESSSVSSFPARTSFPTLELWLEDLVALQRGEEPPLQFVEFGAGETLEPLDGVEILQQTGDVELGDSFAGPGDPTAVAEVRVDGERWYVLARTIRGSAPEYFPTAASVGGPTLDDFLTYAEGKYAEGGGGLR